MSRRVRRTNPSIEQLAPLPIEAVHRVTPEEQAVVELPVREANGTLARQIFGGTSNTATIAAPPAPGSYIRLEDTETRAVRMEFGYEPPIRTRSPVSDIRFSRFRGIVPQEAIEKAIVAVIGCGGIGSWLAMGLGCLGVKLRLYDPDTTGEENFGGQPLPAIGVNKARQLMEWMASPYSDQHLAREPQCYESAFDKKASKLTDATIWAFAVDSIEMRAELYKWACVRFGVDGTPAWVVDGRIGGAESNMLVVPMGDSEARERYAKTLAPAGGFNDDPCTMRSTVFAGMGVAAEMTGAIASIIRKDDMARGRQMNSEWLRLQHFEGWTQ